ncbi:MAG: hypothetical protein H3C43_01580 [Leptonema sp. (in: Bacteria)]|nr:hypothetical protein [Leptonema sp. (in: bacteria)]
MSNFFDINKLILAETDEVDFYTKLIDILEQTGELGHVFTAMVEWNVPIYVLANFWPEKQPTSLTIGGVPNFAYAASEPNWKNKIENLHSNAQKLNDTDFQIYINKSYVMKCESVISLVRYQNTDELCLIHFTMPKQSTQSLTIEKRVEPHTIFVTQNNQTIEHFKLNGSFTINSTRIKQISNRRYRLVAGQIMLREITGLAILATALAKYHNYRNMNNSLMQNYQEQLLEIRSHPQIKRDGLLIATNVIQHFIKSGVPMHSLWLKLPFNIESEG